MGPHHEKPSRAKDSVIALFSMFGGNYLPERCQLSYSHGADKHDVEKLKHLSLSEKKNASIN